MSNFRRRLMAAVYAGGGGIGPDSYIRNGLIFQLDGIDKGATSGAWTDRKGGVVFTNHGAQFGDDSVSFDGNAYLQNLTSGAIGNISSGATIEVVFERYSRTRAILFMQNFPNGDFPVFGPSGELWYSTNYCDGYVMDSNLSERVISVNSSIAVANGVQMTRGTSDYWSIRQGNGIVVGARSPSEDKSVSKIYAIRIYSRSLSADEMIANQRIDNERFNLGLTI